MAQRGPLYPNLPRAGSCFLYIYIYYIYKYIYSILYCPVYTKSGHLVYSV